MIEHSFPEPAWPVIVSSSQLFWQVFHEWIFYFLRIKNILLWRHWSFKILVLNVLKVLLLWRQLASRDVPLEKNTLDSEFYSMMTDTSLIKPSYHEQLWSAPNIVTTNKLITLSAPASTWPDLIATLIRHNQDHKILGSKGSETASSSSEDYKPVTAVATWHPPFHSHHHISQSHHDNQLERCYQNCQFNARCRKAFILWERFLIPSSRWYLQVYIFNSFPWFHSKPIQCLKISLKKTFSCFSLQ